SAPTCTYAARSRPTAQLCCRAVPSRPGSSWLQPSKRTCSSRDIGTIGQLCDLFSVVGGIAECFHQHRFQRDPNVALFERSISSLSRRSDLRRRIDRFPVALSRIDRVIAHGGEQLSDTRPRRIELPLIRVRCRCQLSLCSANTVSVRRLIAMQPEIVRRETRQTANLLCDRGNERFVPGHVRRVELSELSVGRFRLQV